MGWGTSIIFAFFLVGSAAENVQTEPNGEKLCERALNFGLADFRSNTESHIRRVVILGAEILKRFPDEFSRVDPTLLNEFLLLHDQSKVNETPMFLKQYGLEDREKHIIEELWDYFGRWDEMDEQERQKTRRLVDELNAVDHKVAQNFFETKGLIEEDGELSSLAKQYLRIEHIADVVDTVLSPSRAEEFGQVSGIGDARFEDYTDKYIAYSLEKYYRERGADPKDHLFLEPLSKPSTIFAAPEKKTKDSKP